MPRLHPDGVVIFEDLQQIGVRLDEQLVLQVFQFAYFLVELVLLFYLVDIDDDLSVYLHQRMISLHKVVFHVAARLGHVGIVGHEEESLLVVDQFLTLLYHRSDAMALLVHILQLLFLDDVVGLLLVGIVHIAFQVHDILQGSESCLFQQLPHAVLVARLSVDVGLLQVITYILFQRIDTLLDAQHADFLVDIQHLLEKVEVVALDLYRIARFDQHRSQ